MIVCGSSECEFFVHAHYYRDNDVHNGDACPYCNGKLVEKYPEEPKWTAKRLNIKSEQFLSPNGKVVVNRVEKYAKEHNQPKDRIMEVAKAGCKTCRKAKVNG